MAGLGAKLFSSFTKLTAAQVNGYLMDQSIMRFANAAARDAAFGGAGEPTLAEGMFCYLDDTNQLLVYNGSAWIVPNSPAQNPTGLELITTTTCTSGGTASNGIVTIGSAVASVTVSTCFNSTYDSYRILINNPTGSTADGLRFQLGGITTGVYYGNWNYALYNATALNVNPNNAGVNMTIGLTDTSPLCFSTFDIANPNTTAVKILAGNYFGRGYAGTFGCYVSSSVQATSFVISNSSGTLTGGTIAVYGYRK